MCANEPGSNLKYLENYLCPLWHKDEYRGCFDEAGYDIDHITEFSIDQNDDFDNLQALCKNCHSVKTKKFMIFDNKKKNITKHNHHNKKKYNKKRTYNKIRSYDKIKSYNKDGLLEYECPKCSKKFNKKSNLKYHLNRINPCDRPNGFPCEHCNKNFTRKDNLERHITTIHKKSTNINNTVTGDNYTIVII